MKYSLLLYLIPFVLFSCVNPRKGNTPSSQTELNNHLPLDSISPSVNPNAKNVLNEEKPIINVYLENSGSMLGYINGKTDFINSLYNYLSDIRIAEIANEINLFYINRNIIPRGNDISYFIDNLSPNNFLIGETGTSDIADVLGTVLSDSTSNTISILISDFIFSPDSQIDPKEYLIIQQTKIKNLFADKLKDNPNMATIIYQLNSQFNGVYYNIHNQQTRIDNERPYYIWVMGNTENIAQLKDIIPDNKFKGNGIKNLYTLLPTFNEIEYGVLSSPRYGSFKRNRNNPTKSIYKLKKERKGKYAGEFMFTIGANLSLLNIIIGDNYLMNVDNYVCKFNNVETDDFNFTIHKIKNVSGSGYTHQYRINPKKLASGEVKLSLINKIPDWVYASNDEIGLNINSEGAMEKTFGIKNLVEGVYEAYEALGYTNYGQMIITLN